MSKDSIIISKIIHSLEKVFPTKEPCGEISFSKMLKNEEHNFQIAYFNQNDSVISNFSIKAEGALANYFSFREVALVPVTVVPTYLIMDDYYLSNEIGLYPDILKPFGKLGIVIPSCQWKSVWVSLNLTQDVVAGKYATDFVLYDEKGDEIDRVTYTIDIIDGLLIENDLKLTNWIHYDCISNTHNVALFSDEFYKVFEKYLKEYIDIGFNMLYTPIFTPTLDTKVGLERKTAQLVKVDCVAENYTFDFSLLNKFIDFATDKGIKYFELSHLFTQWGGEYCPKIMVCEDGKYYNKFGWNVKANSKEYRNFLSQFLPAISDFLYKKGIHKNCYFHLTDEPTKKDYENYKFCREIYKKYIQDIPTMDALFDSKFLEDGLVDVAVPILHEHKSFVGISKNDLFLYYCTPKSGYFTNRIINMPSLRTRILGVQLYEAEVQGFLHWGYNFYNSSGSEISVNPYLDTSSNGGFVSGDGFIVYPTEEGIIGSIRSEMYKEAFQDYRLLITLEQKIGKEKVKRILHENGIEWLDKYPRNNIKFLTIKDKIYELIRG